MKAKAGIGDKKRISPRQKCRREIVSPLGQFPKPLKGRHLYLDLNVYRGNSRLEENLRLLGAIVEKCFSKDVHVVITDKGTPQDYERPKNRSHDSNNPNSPVTPSPFNLATMGLDSPPANSPSGPDGKKMLTRGQKIAQAAKLTRSYGTTNVVENARKLKIKVTHIEVVQKWVQREIDKIPKSLREGKTPQNNNSAKRPSKVKRLKSPFLKFEAVVRHYRPLHQEFDAVPTLDFNTAPWSCPFEKGHRASRRGTAGAEVERAEAEERDLPPQAINTDTSSSQEQPGIKKNNRHGNKTLSSEDSYCAKIMTKGDLRRKVQEKQRLEAKKGYCEMCNTKYDDMHKHTLSEQHKRFVRNSDNYHALDQLIEQGPNMDQLVHNAVTKQTIKDKEKKQRTKEEVVLLTPVKRTTRKTGSVTPIKSPEKSTLSKSNINTRKPLLNKKIENEVRSPSVDKTKEKSSRNLTENTEQITTKTSKDPVCSPKKNKIVDKDSRESVSMKIKEKNTPLSPRRSMRNQNIDHNELKTDEKVTESSKDKTKVNMTNGEKDVKLVDNEAEKHSRKESSTNDNLKEIQKLKKSPVKNNKKSKDGEGEFMALMLDVINSGILKSPQGEGRRAKRAAESRMKQQMGVDSQPASQSASPKSRNTPATVSNVRRELTMSPRTTRHSAQPDLVNGISDLPKRSRSNHNKDNADVEGKVSSARREVSLSPARTVRSTRANSNQEGTETFSASNDHMVKINNDKLVTGENAIIPSRATRNCKNEVQSRPSRSQSTSQDIRHTRREDAQKRVTRSVSVSDVPQLGANSQRKLENKPLNLESESINMASRSRSQDIEKVQPAEVDKHMKEMAKSPMRQTRSRSIDVRSPLKTKATNPEESPASKQHQVSKDKHTDGDLQIQKGNRSRSKNKKPEDQVTSRKDQSDDVQIKHSARSIRSANHLVDEEILKGISADYDEGNSCKKSQQKAEEKKDDKKSMKDNDAEAERTIITPKSPKKSTVCNSSEKITAKNRHSSKGKDERESKENEVPSNDEDDAEKNKEKKKLKRSWSVVSDRSMREIVFSSEGDAKDSADFEGFPSMVVEPRTDMSYESVSEIEDDHVSEEDSKEVDLEKGSSSLNILGVDSLVGDLDEPFEASSDWDEQIEDFFDNRQKQLRRSPRKTPMKSFMLSLSPRKSPRNSSKVYNFVVSPKKSPLKLSSSKSPRKSGVNFLSPLATRKSPRKSLSGFFSPHTPSFSMFETNEEDSLWAGPVRNDPSRYAKQGSVYKPSTPQEAKGVFKEKSAGNTPRSYLKTSGNVLLSPTEKTKPSLSVSFASTPPAMHSTPVRPKQTQTLQVVNKTPLVKQPTTPHGVSPLVLNNSICPPKVSNPNLCMLSPKGRSGASDKTGKVKVDSEITLNFSSPNKQKVTKSLSCLPSPIVNKTASESGNSGPRVSLESIFKNSTSPVDGPTPAKKRLLKYSSSVRKTYNLGHIPGSHGNKSEHWVKNFEKKIVNKSFNANSSKNEGDFAANGGVSFCHPSFDKLNYSMTVGSSQEPQNNTSNLRISPRKRSLISPTQETVRKNPRKVNLGSLSPRKKLKLDTDFFKEKVSCEERSDRDKKSQKSDQRTGDSRHSRDNSERHSASHSERPSSGQRTGDSRRSSDTRKSRDRHSTSHSDRHKSGQSNANSRLHRRSKNSQHEKSAHTSLNLNETSPVSSHKSSGSGKKRSSEKRKNSRRNKSGSSSRAHKDWEKSRLNQTIDWGNNTDQSGTEFEDNGNVSFSYKSIRSNKKKQSSSSRKSTRHLSGKKDKQRSQPSQDKFSSKRQLRESSYKSTYDFESEDDDLY